MSSIRTMARKIGSLQGMPAAILRDRGSVLVLAAAALFGVCALVGLSIDTGQVMVNRRHLQNAVDSAALAGAQQLPASPDAARADAVAWLQKNGYKQEDVTISLSRTYVLNDTISVTARESLPLFISPIFGKDGTSVTAGAKAIVGSVTGIAGILPFGVVTSHSDCFSAGNPQFGLSCTLKLGSSGGGDGGDFGALTLGSSGASAYKDNIVNGSVSDYHDGQTLLTETGNMTGPTGQGLKERLLREPTSGCGNGAGQDTFSEVFTPGAGGYYGLNCPDSPRLIILPLVNQLANPAPSTVVDFTLMYIEDFKFNGGHSDVRGKLVRVNITDPEAAFGAFHDNGLRLIKLAE